MSTQLTARFIQLSPRVALIADVLKRHNLPAHHLRSTCQAIFQRHARSFDDITSLPRAVRLDLAREMSAMAPPRSEHVTADTVDDNEASGSTLTLRASHLQPSEQCVKTLLELHDGRSVEAVWMRFRGGQAPGEVDNRGHGGKSKRDKDTVVGHRSLCISSQVGCALKVCALSAISATRLARFRLNAQPSPRSATFARPGSPGSSVNSLSTRSSTRCCTLRSNPTDPSTPSPSWAWAKPYKIPTSFAP